MVKIWISYSRKKKRKKMATKKVNTYVEMDLDWLEKKVQELREYCDATPISKIKDRVVSGRLMATIEQQIKSVRDTLQDCAKMLEVIDKLREKEGAKGPSVRGDQELSPMEKGEI